MISFVKPGDKIKVDVYDRRDNLLESQVEVTCIELKKFKNSGISFPCGSSGPWISYKGNEYCVYGDYSIVV